MNIARLGKTVLRLLLHILFAVYEGEVELLFQLVTEVRAKGLTADEARKEVFRRFRERYAGEIKDSLLNLLIEAAVVSQKS